MELVPIYVTKEIKELTVVEKHNEPIYHRTGIKITGILTNLKSTGKPSQETPRIAILLPS